MSIPTQPTETSIVLKSFRLYGKTSPTTADQTNAIADGVGMVKNDIMQEGREWAPLRKLAFLPCTINVNNVQLPTDFSKTISASMFDGTRRGTAQGGAAATVTLAAADTGSASATEGKLIAITSGTGSGQALQVKSYATATNIATMAASWATQPDSSSVYLVVDEQHEISLEQIWNFDEDINLPHLLERPRSIYHQGDLAEGDLYFDRTPDKVYVLQLRYYTDLRKEDTDASANVKYNRLLRIFEQLFVQGTFVWLLQDDSRHGLEFQKYSQMLARAAAEFLYPNNVNQGAELGEDAY